MSNAIAGTRPVAVKLEQKVLDRIKRLAEARNRSTHWMMREAVQQYVEREEKREAFRADAIRAWQEYQATGQHVTQQEADAWLAKLQDGQDVELPDCHG
jgi:predicted transcriptional regulator